MPRKPTKTTPSPSDRFAEIDRQIAKRRKDTEFQKRRARLVAENREVLALLAQS